ncbi:MAG: SPOCS domain-containing protein [Kineothrix sp.]
MELVKKNIHMDRIKGQAATQITLEDDVNISDMKPDAARLVYDKGSIALEEIKVSEDHVSVRGKLQFMIMYLTEGENPVPACMEGSLPFDEQIYMEGAQAGDSVNVKWMLEDLTVGLINSRKLSVQALITLKLCAEVVYDEETTVDLYHEEPVEYRRKPLRIAQMTVKKRDIFRIKEELELPQNFPNIFQILWQSIELGSVEFKPLEGRISVQGEVGVFFLYEGEGEEQAVRPYQTTLSFNGSVECAGCGEGMAEDIGYLLTQKEVEVRPDFDGEQRVFAIELVMDMDISLYQEERLEILSGVYGVVKEVEAVSRPARFKSIVGRTAAKYKVADRMKISPSEVPMVQLLHSEAQVQVESEEIVENGLHIQGTLNVQGLYLGSDDKIPYSSVKGAIPFSYVLELPNVHKDCICRVQAEAEQLMVAMLDSSELDVKAVIVCRAVVFEQRVENVVTDILVSDLDMNKLNELPGIVIYIAKEGDSLWDVGKRYYVPISQIKETNDMSSEEIRPGDKLLIVKGMNS